MALGKANTYFQKAHWKGFGVKTKSQRIKNFINLKETKVNKEINHLLYFEDSCSPNFPLVPKCHQRMSFACKWEFRWLESHCKIRIRKKLSVLINFTKILLNNFYSTFVMWRVPSVLGSIVRDPLKLAPSSTPNLLEYPNPSISGRKEGMDILRKYMGYVTHLSQRYYKSCW